VVTVSHFAHAQASLVAMGLLGWLPSPVSPSQSLLREGFKRCLNTITGWDLFGLPSRHLGSVAGWAALSRRTGNKIVTACAWLFCSPSLKVFPLKHGFGSTTTVRSSLTNPMLEPEHPSSGSGSRCHHPSSEKL